MTDRLGRVLAALLLALTAAAAPAAPVFHTLALGGETFDTEWHEPAGRPVGLLLLQHGFGRRCANLRGTARGFADAGLLVLCLNADMARGNPALAAAYAQSLLSGQVVPPDGGPLPERIVVAGHSAGGFFAVHLALGLARDAPARVAGAVLLDVVGGAELAATLAALAPRPVLALVSPPSPCNARQQALPALRASGLQGHVQIVESGPQGTHLDAEGDDSERVAIWACREGAPRADAVAQLRRRASSAALGMAQAAR